MTKKTIAKSTPFRPRTPKTGETAPSKPTGPVFKSQDEILRTAKNILSTEQGATREDLQKLFQEYKAAEHGGRRAIMNVRCNQIRELLLEIDVGIIPSFLSQIRGETHNTPGSVAKEVSTIGTKPVATIFQEVPENVSSVTSVSEAENERIKQLRAHGRLAYACEEIIADLEEAGEVCDEMGVTYSWERDIYEFHIHIHRGNSTIANIYFDGYSTGNFDVAHRDFPLNERDLELLKRIQGLMDKQYEEIKLLVAKERQTPVEDPNRALTRRESEMFWRILSAYEGGEEWTFGHINEEGKVRQYKRIAGILSVYEEGVGRFWMQSNPATRTVCVREGKGPSFILKDVPTTVFHRALFDKVEAIRTKEAASKGKTKPVMQERKVALEETFLTPVEDSEVFKKIVELGKQGRIECNNLIYSWIRGLSGITLHVFDTTGIEHLNLDFNEDLGGRLRVIDFLGEKRSRPIHKSDIDWLDKFHEAKKIVTSVQKSAPNTPAEIADMEAKKQRRERMKKCLEKGSPLYVDGDAVFIIPGWERQRILVTSSGWIREGKNTRSPIEEEVSAIEKLISLQEKRTR